MARRRCRCGHQRGAHNEPFTRRSAVVAWGCAVCTCLRFRRNWLWWFR